MSPDTDKITERLEKLGASRLGEHIEEGKDETKNLVKIFGNHGIKKDVNILDLGCGVGRHDIPLAKKGYEVTGIDIGESRLERARKYAKREGVSDRTNFILKDMRNLQELDGKFKIIISLFDAFGSCSNEENIEIIEKATELAVQNGIFILDVLHRDSTIANKYHPYDNNTSAVWTSDEENMFEAVDKSLDFLDGREYTERTMFNKDDYKFIRDRKYSQRLYTTQELKKIFENLGWELKEVYNNLKRERLSLDGVRQVLVFKKKK